jgi:hypothetical protein
MGNTFKTIKSDHKIIIIIIKMSHFYVAETCQNLAFDFKFYIIQGFNIFIK